MVNVLISVNWISLHYELLPISLRYPGVNYDDVMHGWTEKRTMNIGRINAKKLLAGFRISQSNPYMIARLFHFASLSDCYWLKEEKEDLSWEQISLFKNPLEKAVTATALLGCKRHLSAVDSKNPHARTYCSGEGGESVDTGRGWIISL